VTGLDPAEAPELPTEFEAIAEKEYAVPLVSPEIVHEVEVVEHVNPLGKAVTVYSVGAPPEPGATLMVAEPLLVTTEVMLGVPGATVPVVGVNPPDAAEATEVPELFVAVTVKE